MGWSHEQRGTPIFTVQFDSMPKRTDIQNILIIGSGPIVIGQGCEFDYSGTQACKALREEGYTVVLLNSNPATIMTDPNMADRTYIEPITPEFVEKVLQREQDEGHPIDAILPTLGGQTGLNCAMEASERGIIKKYGVQLIGADEQAIHKAENRQAFRQTMIDTGQDVPRSGIAHTEDEAWAVIEDVKLPCAIRPAYTLGGEGGGFASTKEEFITLARRGLAYSRINEILIEEDLTGWKEFELEVMRDRADNVVIICSIENIDAMGVHTGDSITVAPAQTLSDKEYQRMRDSAIAIIRAIGVETGGSNIQFAVHPDTGRQVVIEMNPRVSRSSALASKATGFPIAKIAAKLAVGYTLDELPNDITRQTPASFEPTIDYVVVKIPRWTFEKFPEADETLTTQMKSVGEGMAIGRTFKEAFQKGIRSMEIKRYGYGRDANDKWLASAEGIASRKTHDDPAFYSAETEASPDTEEEHARNWPIPEEILRDKLSRPCQGRPYYIRYAFKMDWSVEQVHELTHIDPWFLRQMQELVEEESELSEVAHELTTGAKDVESTSHRLSRLKRQGYSDIQLEHASRGMSAEDFRNWRRLYDVVPGYKLVDTCAAEFESYTPYYYSSHDSGFEVQSVVINVEGRQHKVSFADYEQPSPAVVDHWRRILAETHREDVSRWSPEQVTEAMHKLPAETVFQAPAGRGADEARVSNKRKIVVLGGGPNRIGQGIEFDYCCCHAAFTAKRHGFESVMVNSNPETVSTDYDTSDMLFFEPLTHEDVLHICERLNDKTLQKNGNEDGGYLEGAIVQFGGQTPLNLAQGLKDAGVPILGTQPEMIHLAEDRDKFKAILNELSILQPPNGIAHSLNEAKEIANEIGYPVLVRPSYVLGGRGMQVCNHEPDLTRYMKQALGATDRISRENPILIDKFLTDAIEVDVDAVADYGQPGRDPDSGRRRSIVCGIMEHIEEAGVHSGDSACVLPPYSLGRLVIDEIFRATRRLAQKLRVCGLMNIQYAVVNRTVYVLEVNPRASRTVPFVAKATGVPWVEIATRVMIGQPLDEVLDQYGITETPWPKHVSIKAPVFPFTKFPGVDVILGPEMRSTGEVMGIDRNMGLAYAKAQIAAGSTLPTHGKVLISVNDPDKPRIIPVAREFYELGFHIYSTPRTHARLESAGIPATLVSKEASNGNVPYLLDLINEGKLDLLINTPIHTGSASDEGRWRSAAALRRIPLVTSLAAALAAVTAIRTMHDAKATTPTSALAVKPLQSYHTKK
jgi:carbamoyl-phosphate synthase large subunit